MRELSIFVNESGRDGLPDCRYPLAVLMHDQTDGIADSSAAYEGTFSTSSRGTCLSAYFRIERLALISSSVSIAIYSSISFQHWGSASYISPV